MSGSVPSKKTSRRAVGITTGAVLEVPSSSLSDTAPSHCEKPENTLAMAFAQATTLPKTNISSPTKAKISSQHSPRFQEIQCERQQLPAWQYKNKFLELLRKNQVIIIEGETGCGKTTQVPQWAIEYTKKKQAVACTQPRRIAASSIAKRVAAEMDVEVGEEVGYHIRFEKCTSAKTILTYMTEGILLRQITSHPMLYHYGVIVLDECHERGVFADVLMGLLLDIANERKDLRLVIMSATLDRINFQKYFGYPPILSIPGRVHNINIEYACRDQWDFVRSAVVTVKDIHRREKKRGDILIFVPGQEDIDRICGQLEFWKNGPNYRLGDLHILPFYSALPKEEQDLVFVPIPSNNSHGISRKVIVATNIAETSITISGVAFVIDSGYMNVETYDWKTRAELIIKVRITKTNAQQRAGRVGRTQPGTCYRLYTEETSNEMEPYIRPEVLHTNLSCVVLNLKDMKKDPLHFNFMDPPEMQALKAAITELRQLRALDKDNVITQLGKCMAEFPIDPRVSKVLVNSCNYSCQEEILTVAAMLTVPSCFITNRKLRLEINEAHQQFISPHGDHIMLMNVYNAYRASGESQEWCYQNFIHHRHLRSAVGIRSQLKAILQKMNMYPKYDESCDGPKYINTRKALLSGFCLQVASKGDPGYRPLYEPDTVVELHASTGLNRNLYPYVIYHERYTTTKHFIRTVTPIDSGWWDEVVGLSVEELELL